MLHKLTRFCNNKERYYSLFIYETLFGDFCVERIFGAVVNKKPTGIVREFFSDETTAQAQFATIMKAKISKGYLLVK